MGGGGGGREREERRGDVRLPGSGWAGLSFQGGEEQSRDNQGHRAVFTSDSKSTQGETGEPGIEAAAGRSQPAQGRSRRGHRPSSGTWPGSPGRRASEQGQKASKAQLPSLPKRWRGPARSLKDSACPVWGSCQLSSGMAEAGTAGTQQHSQVTQSPSQVRLQATGGLSAPHLQ